MSSTGVRWNDDHMVDLLPAFVNDTLDPDQRAAVTAHLSTCAECRTSLSAWRVIAQVTRQASALAEQRVVQRTVAPFPAASAPETVQPFALSTDAIKEKHVNTITGATATLPDVSDTFPRIPSRRAINRAFRPMTQIAAAAAIILAVAAGMFVYANGVPEGGLNSFVPGALPSSQENRCTLTPPSDEQLSRILGVNSILLGSSAEITRWIEPAVRVDLSIDLPNSSAADQSTIDRVNETWNEFRACSNVENRTASFAVMSEDGVRRVFFRNIYSDVIAMAIPMSHMTGEKATSMEVNPAATPATVSGWTEPDETTLTLGETRLLDDGRVISALVDPATPGQTELAGYAVFVNVNGTWLIDDFIVSKG